LSISLLLEMAVSADPDRAAVAWDARELTTGGLSDLADGGAGVIAKAGAQHVAYVGGGAAMLLVLMFSAARAGVPVTHRKHHPTPGSRHGDRQTRPRL
jgi:hypothetical protein